MVQKHLEHLIIPDIFLLAHKKRRPLWKVRDTSRETVISFHPTDPLHMAVYYGMFSSTILRFGFCRSACQGETSDYHLASCLGMLQAGANNPQ